MKELYLLCQHDTGRELAIRFTEGRLPSVPDRYHAYAVLTEAPEYDEKGNAILPTKSGKSVPQMVLNGTWEASVTGDSFGYPPEDMTIKAGTLKADTIEANCRIKDGVDVQRVAEKLGEQLEKRSGRV